MIGLIRARERRAEHTLVEISAALAADLALLTDALDVPGADVTAAVRQFAADAGLAVPSYLGMTVFTTGTEATFAFSLMADDAAERDVLASLMMPLSQIRRSGVDDEIAVVLYAAHAGAFVDLAADLAWLLGCEIGDIAFDEHLLAVGLDSAGSLSVRSVINQALGVLIGRGLTPEQADVELDVRASAASTDRHGAAALILTDLAGAADG